MLLIINQKMAKCRALLLLLFAALVPVWAKDNPRAVEAKVSPQGLVTVDAEFQNQPGEPASGRWNTYNIDTHNKTDMVFPTNCAQDLLLPG
jgi:hypothetical protein